MPPGAKKRKALKKKKQQQRKEEAIGTRGNDEHGSQDDRESDSNLSSPVSQEFDGTKHSSAAISSGLVKNTATEISDVTLELGPNSGNATAVERGTHDKGIIVEKPPISSYENTTQTAKNAASQDPCVKEIAPVVDSVPKAVIFEKNETSTHSNLFIQKSGESKEYLSTGLEKENGKLAIFPAGTSKRVESVRESEVSLSSEEKRLLLPGPPAAVRTSWLSCCGLFDAMTGSDR